MSEQILRDIAEGLHRDGYATTAGIIRAQANQMERLEKENADLWAWLAEAEARYKYLRDGAVKAASAPGKDWVDEQMELALVLMKLDEAAQRGGEVSDEQ